MKKNLSFRLLALFLAAMLLLTGCSASKAGEKGAGPASSKPSSGFFVSSEAASGSSSKPMAEAKEISEYEIAYDAKDGAFGSELPYGDSTFTATTEESMATGVIAEGEAMPAAPGSMDPAPSAVDTFDTDVLLDAPASVDSDFAFEPADSTDIVVLPEEPAEVIWYNEPINPGTLTAGEWNDNKNFEFLCELINKPSGEEMFGGQGTSAHTFADYFREWGLTPFKRVAVHLTTADGANVSGAQVCITGEEGKILANTRTDNTGMSYCFYALKGGDTPQNIVVYADGYRHEQAVTSEDLLEGHVTEISLGSDFAPLAHTKSLDLMLLVDTTGSMGDEIRYLQVELDDVINKVRTENGNLPIRLSVNFYRDLEDDYVVRSNPFDEDIDKQLTYLRAESADGGGDYEEAVEMALDDAINNHSWNEDSVKIMFMVLDAPPHNTDEVKGSLWQSVQNAQIKGIRIIPIASSGVDKSTEFLLRTLAMSTGGTYTFLTDDSGIGESHLEPTVGNYEVEKLCDLMVRLVNGYLK